MNIPRPSFLTTNVGLAFSLMMASISYADDEPLAKKKAIVSLGLGSIYAPKFTGAAEYETLPIPVIFVQFDRFTLGGVSGISYDVYRGEGVKAGVAFGYFRGRDESDADYLLGLGDIESSADIRLFVRKAFGPFYLTANITHDFSEDVGGVTSAVSAGYSYRVTPQFSLSTNILMRWMNDDHASAVFGVSEQQAKNSNLPQTEVEAGAESGALSLTALYFINRRWTITSTISRTQYLGDAEQSAVMRESTPKIFITSASYQF